MYTPITKRVKVAQHKSSVAKQTTETAQTADAEGNLQTTTGKGNEGTYTPPEKYEGPGACEDPNSAKCKEWKSENERCKQNPNAEGCSGFKKFEIGTNTPGSADFESKPVMQDAKAASRIDLYSSPEGRASFRTGQSQGRFVRKTANQSAKAEDKLAKFLEKNKDVKPEPGDKNYKKYQKLLTASETFKSQKEGAENRLKNYRQMTDGMRNRYLSQTMDYDRDLTKGRDAGPVKAPAGTQTEEEFKSKFKKGLGIDSDSSNPQTVTTPTSSLSEVAATSYNPEMVARYYKPITLDTGALFQELDSSVSDFTNKIKKGAVGRMTNKPGAFKMKGYGSKR
jgi:hypothetical protein